MLESDLKISHIAEWVLTNQDNSWRFNPWPLVTDIHKFNIKTNFLNKADEKQVCVEICFSAFFGWEFNEQIRNSPNKHCDRQLDRWRDDFETTYLSCNRSIIVWGLGYTWSGKICTINGMSPVFSTTKSTVCKNTLYYIICMNCTT